MRVMVMIKATARTEAGVMPSQELIAAMGKFNEELVKAGVMLDGDGLQPSSRGKRVRPVFLLPGIEAGTGLGHRDVPAGRRISASTIPSICAWTDATSPEASTT